MVEALKVEGKGRTGREERGISKDKPFEMIFYNKILIRIGTRLPGVVPISSPISHLSTRHPSFLGSTSYFLIPDASARSSSQSPQTL